MGTNQVRKHRGDELLIDIRMKRLYDTIEPNIISNKLLTQAVYEQGPKDEAGKIAKNEGILFSTVLSMRLDFKNILEINNLWAFKSLTKLQLVSNIIEKIQNLDCLVHLEWLDLSFNKIEEIEGLDNLIKLTDLSLYCNRIKIIQNMDTLKELNVFSIGKNLLSSIDNVLYLRKFKKLQSLNLAGNPLCNSHEYFSLIFAFFPNILFLDYKMVTKAEQQVCYEKYLIRVEQFKEKEFEREKIEADERGILEARKIHTLAFVELLDTDALFNQMINEDSERDKIFAITGVEELAYTFREKFQVISNELFHKGIEEMEKRKRDTDLFYSCINACKNENNQKALNLVTEFNLKKIEIMYEMNKTNNVDEQALDILKEMIYDLWSNLMSLEVQIFDQLEETIRDYLRNLTEMIDGFLEHVHSHFAQMRDLETSLTERINEFAIVVFDKIMKGDMEEDRITNFKKAEIFNDKDSMANCIATSHDHRVLKIDNWEDGMKNKMQAWLQETSENVKNEEEYERNRTRLTEINSFIDHMRSEIENFEIPGVNIN